MWRKRRPTALSALGAIQQMCRKVMATAGYSAAVVSFGITTNASKISSSTLAKISSRKISSVSGATGAATRKSILRDKEIW